MTYDFTVTIPGTYYVHFLVNSASGSDDSLHWGIDGTWLDMKITDTALGSWFWETGGVQTGSLTAATHTLNVWMREDGQKIDKIVINQSATPDQGPVVEDFSVTVTTSGASSINATMPPGTVEGELLVAIMSTDGGGETLGAPGDWTPIQGPAGANHTSRSWYKVAGASEAGPYTFTVGSSEEIVVGILRISGADQSSPIDDSSTPNSVTGVSPLAFALNTTVSDTLILRYFGADDNDITQDSGYPGSHTGVYVRGSAGGNNQTSSGVAYTTQAPIGWTGTATFTNALTSSEEWSAVTIAVKPPVSAAITGTNPASLTETNLNGADVTVTITHATYDASLFTTDFTLNGAPAGTTINSVVRDTGTQATLTLLFDGTDFDTNASLSVTVLQAALAVGTGPATTGTVTVTAVLEVSAAITGTSPASLTETNLNGATVTVELTDGTYDASLFTTDFTLNGAPAGTTINSVARDTGTQATLTLAFDGTDFDTNASMSVTVLQAAFSPATGSVTTGTVTVTTVLESAAITGTNPASLTETNLNGADVTVTITNATYDASLLTTDFTLNGAPAGTTINSVVRDTGTQATLTLAFDGTDFDTNASMSVTVLQAAFSPAAGPETTGTVTVTALLESAAITGTNPASLTETNLNGADVTVTITNATYDASLFTTDFTLNGAPTGTTINSVAWDSATQATLTLAFDGTDFDTNASLSVTVLQAAFSPVAGPETTGTVTVTTVLESAAITGTNPASLTETNLNGATVTVTITNATYDASLFTTDFTLNGAPTGTTITSVAQDTGTQATLTLAFDGTDFDTNASLSVTVLQAAFSPAAGPETTGTVTVTAVVEPPPTISTMETADLDNDGFIDAIHITFSEAIKDSPVSTVVANDWDVAGVTGEAFSSTTNGDIADDADIYITFQDGVLDTGQTPQVTYTKDEPTDPDVKNLAGTLLANVTPGTATVQRGTVTMAASATSVDGTITTPVVLANTLLFYQSRNASAGPLGFSVTGQLIDTTTVRFQRDTGDATAADIDWQVWEDSNLTVQRGSIADLSSGLCHNITISTVDLSKSFVLVAMRNKDTSTQGNNFIRARLTTTTNMELCVATNSSGAQGVEWQVAEYANAAVQRGQLVFGTSDASLTAAITSVDLSKAMLLYSWEAAEGTVANIGQKLFQGKFDTSTQISVTRDNTGSAATVNWEVIEFTDGKSVQSGDLNFATADTQKNVGLSGFPNAILGPFGVFRG